MVFFFFRVHIRRTDKVGTEAAFHKLDEYMVHVEEYYKNKELIEKLDKKRVYLATDEPKLFSEAKHKYVTYIVNYNYYFRVVNYLMFH